MDGFIPNNRGRSLINVKVGIMKKILLLCDGDHFPSGAIRFILQMRESEPIYVKGMFFAPVDALEMIPVGFMPISGPNVMLKEREQSLVNKSQVKFVEAFKNARIKYEIHPIEAAWDVDLFKTESRFSDLVVISEELFCKNTIEDQPNHFMAEALRASECPVTVVPENFKYIERLAIAYDGEKESMHAIKQFVYLFPELTELPTEIVNINKETTEDIPNRELLREYTFSRFQAQYTSKLHFDPQRYFTSWIEEKKNVLLIAGSFSRSPFSNHLRKSFAERIIAEHTCPIFIAHFS
jgi:hypothetical protein